MEGAFCGQCGSPAGGREVTATVSRSEGATVALVAYTAK
jgi:hypothetical protein